MDARGGATNKGTISLADFNKRLAAKQGPRKGDSGRWSTPAPQSASFYNAQHPASSSSSISPSDSDSEDGVGLTPAESADELRAKYETIIERGRREGASRIDRNLYTLRRLVLVEGIPPDERELAAGGTKMEGGAAGGGGVSLDVGPGSVMWDCSLRARIWKILLRVPAVDADRYAELVRRGAFKGRDSEEYKQIRKDVGRTGFRKNPAFLKRVPDAKLSRVLNALLHSCGAFGLAFLIIFVVALS